MEADDIIRALAATDPASFDAPFDDYVCLFCDRWQAGADGLRDPANHEPGCTWRRAHEWVAQHAAATSP